MLSKLISHAILAIPVTIRVPSPILQNVGAMMASLMDALASVVRNSSELRSFDGVGEALVYRSSAISAVYKDSNMADYSSFLDNLRSEFLRLWLTEARLFNVQPPLVQAALAALGGLGWRNSPSDLFEAHSYYDVGPAAYNYATLGQILADRAVKEVAAPTNAEYQEYRQKWRKFWKSKTLTDYHTAYCILARESQSAGHASFTRVNESTLDGDTLAHVMGTQLAYLALEQLPFKQNRAVPTTKLSPKALFLLFHCHYSCGRGRPLYSLDERCMVLLQNWATFTSRLPCGIDITRKTFEACRYI